MKKYLFITNSNKTLFYKEIASEIEKETQNQVYWIVTSKKYLTTIDSNKYILVNNEILFSDEVNDLSKVESVNEILYSDRVLKKNQSGRRILEISEGLIYEYIKDKQIDYVIGERCV